jgi:hypothetical protein
MQSTYPKTSVLWMTDPRVVGRMALDPRVQQPQESGAVTVVDQPARRTDSKRPANAGLRRHESGNIRE